MSIFKKYRGVSAFLRSVADGDIKLSGYCAKVGICSTLSRLFDVSHSITCGMAEDWPGSSGIKHYPIPSEESGVSPVQAYTLHKGDMWNPDHHYGRSRLDLCRHLSRKFAEVAYEIRRD